MSQALNSQQKDYTALRWDSISHCPIYALPEEVLIEILRFLPPRDLGTVAQVCEKWRSLGEDDALWRETNSRHGFGKTRGTVRAKETAKGHRIFREAQKSNCRARILIDSEERQEILKQESGLGSLMQEREVSENERIEIFSNEDVTIKFSKPNKYKPHAKTIITATYASGCAETITTEENIVSAKCGRIDGNTITLLFSNQIVFIDIESKAIRTFSDLSISEDLAIYASRSKTEAMEGPFLQWINNRLYVIARCPGIDPFIKEYTFKNKEPEVLVEPSPSLLQRIQQAKGGFFGLFRFNFAS